MKADLGFCMASFLQYRAIVDHDCCFREGLRAWHYEPQGERFPVNTARELDAQLRLGVRRALEQGRCALMLSSGMDSAILARYLPEGTKAYTLCCRAQGALDETAEASRYARENGLDHEIVEVTWDDYERYALPLMARRGCPIHPLEVQVLVAAQKAREVGIDTLIFGETADIIYGGHSGLLSRDWTGAEFLRRFSFVEPALVMRRPLWIESPVAPYVREDGNVDVAGFLNGFEYPVSLGFYNNGCAAGNVRCATPYAATVLGHPLDLNRIRGGEGKYVVRQLYRQLYPDYPVPPKTPLPRPMAQWLKDWEGPRHPALYRDHIPALTGDQKWYVYALDRFLCEIVEA